MTVPVLVISFSQDFNFSCINTVYLHMDKVYLREWIFSTSGLLHFLLPFVQLVFSGELLTCQVLGTQSMRKTAKHSVPAPYILMKKTQIR
jgi:hypothetical protein